MIMFMLTDFTNQLSGAELLGLWIAGAVLLNLSLWAAFSFRPWRICLPPAIASGVCSGLILCAALTRLVY